MPELGGPPPTSKTVYYAHCISIFDTPQEARDIELLEKLGFLVYNPNNPKDLEAYGEYGMAHFKSLVGDCDVLAFRALPGGNIPAGVFKEIRFAMERILVFELPSSILGREISVEETREYLREVGQR